MEISPSTRIPRPHLHSIKSSTTAKWAGDCDNGEPVDLSPNEVCMINSGVDSNVFDDDPDAVSK